MPRMQPALPITAHYKSGGLKASPYPHQCSKCLDTNLGTFYSDNQNNPLCPGEKTKFITVQKPIHILWLPPDCSTTPPHFHLPPWFEPPTLAVNISLGIANLNMVNMSSLDFCIWQHLKDHRNETQLHHLSSIPSVPITQLYKHMISGQWTYHPLYITYWVSRWYSINLDTIFSHRSLHNGYRITYTSHIGDLLLLFLLVLTCQISTLTFTTRFYVIYYCGW